MKTNHWLACTMLSIALGLQGCGGSSTAPEPAEAPAAPATPAVSEEAPAPAAEAPAEPAEPAMEKAPLDVEGLVAEINAAPDFLAWYGARETYEAAAQPVAEIEAALSAREAALLAESPAQPISDALELVQFHWDIDGEPAAGDERQTFRGTWLFRVKEPVVLPEDNDVRLIVRCAYDSSHQQYFEENKRDFDLTFALTPPVTSWEAGSYQQVSFATYRKLPNIPYRIQTIFSQIQKDENDNWTYVGRYGTAVSHGWRAALNVDVPVETPTESAAPAEPTADAGATEGDTADSEGDAGE